MSTQAATQLVTPLDLPPASASPLVAARLLTKTAARVKIADRVARAFPPLACVRGYRYFHANGVAVGTLTDASCEAEVRGQRTQTVHLRIEDGRLGAACTCAAKTLGPPACKHVWATLLELDRRDAFVSLRGTLRALALTSIDVGPRRQAAPAVAEPEKENAKASAKANASAKAKAKAKASRAR